MLKPWVRESLYESLGEKVRCGVCERRCIINEGKKGFCSTKMNIGGKLYTLVYGDISALESRQIELKPFFHFHPGTRALTFSTWSCNFRCPWCQNHSLSKRKPNPSKANYISPKGMVDKAIKRGDDGICVSFQEPTMLFEYSLDLFKISRKKGFYNCYVSNGYQSLEALRLLKKAGMDAINIDIKGGKEFYEKYCFDIDVNKIWRNIREAKNLGMHVEVVNLVITDVNDSEGSIKEIIDEHLKNAGEKTPLHFTRYYPSYKFENPPTKISTLERAYEMAKEAGILYPYIGNVPGHPYENTYCHNCGELLIERHGYLIKIKKKIDRCPICGEEILIIAPF